jgi:universal stress protein E
MNKLTSILVVVERGASQQHALLKACLLARHFNARLELFLCDAEHAYTLRHIYDRQGVAEAREACIKEARSSLEALRNSLVADDIAIEIDATCESPLYEGIVRKVLRSKPDLVIKGPGPRDFGRGRSFTASDWDLARTCPAPLLLVRGRSWQPQPRFAAALDLSDDEGPVLARSIARTAAYLSLGCGGTMEIFHGATDSTSALRTTLERFGHDYEATPGGVHLVAGYPVEAVPAFARLRDYDVIVLGALTHRRALTSALGTLTDALAEAVKSDLLLIKPSRFKCPIARADEQAAAAAGNGQAVQASSAHG